MTYSALSTALAGRYAIERERFQREIRMAARLQHPHTLTVLGALGDESRFMTLPHSSASTGCAQRIQASSGAAHGYRWSRSGQISCSTGNSSLS